MAQTSSRQTARRGRVFPERRLPPEEIERLKALDEAFYKRCCIVFDRVQPELINNHYDWFIIIEPDSGDYFINPDENIASAEADKKYPDKLCLIMRINETGTCGRI